jgi:hypothetical protein
MLVSGAPCGNNRLNGVAQCVCRQRGDDPGNILVLPNRHRNGACHDATGFQQVKQLAEPCCADVPMDECAGACDCTICRFWRAEGLIEIGLGEVAVDLFAPRDGEHFRRDVEAVYLAVTALMQQVAKHARATTCIQNTQARMGRTMCLQQFGNAG